MVQGMTTVNDQKRMFRNGGINATADKLRDMVSDLRTKRFHLVKKWRLYGCKDEDWKEIEELDIVIDRQIDTLDTLESHKQGRKA